METWICLECGRKFKTAKAAERASMKGCPGCGGTDIDLNVDDGRRIEDREEKNRQTTFV